ncbi:MAG TPA: hypothetical protein VN956_08950 [Pyrinomonadaceae bacterium]|nr:hypothetical protein [Pyrinomonadaceae bacterium]
MTPTFYTTSGDAVVGNPIQLQPAEIRFVPVEQLMPEYLRGRHRWGGIALSYTGNVLEVWAQITFHGIGGGSIDETFNILEEPGSDTREAVWLMPRKSTAMIALGNSSSTAIHTTAQFGGGASEDFEIPAGVTRFVRHHAVEGGNATATTESVKLITVGPEGALRVAGFMFGDNDDFASSIRFYDTKKTVQPNLYAVNLRLKNAAPRIVLKNTSDNEISAQPRFFSAAGEQGSPVDLPSLTLRPQQIMDVDLSALRQAAASRADLDSVSVQIVSSSARGSLIGAAYSTDGATGLTYDVPLRDSGKVRNATGSYPWRVDNDYSTIVVVTNVGNEPARFQVEIRYPDGPYSIKQRELAVGETATFDLRQIRDEQQPDRTGKTLPLTLDRGQFHWTIVATHGDPHIIGRAEVVSRSGRVASSYSCPVCCPDSGPNGGFDPNAYGLSVDGFVYTNAHGDYYDCYFNHYQGSLYFTSMFTYNTNIATVDGGGQLNGIAVGSTEVEGYYDYVEWDNDGMDCYRYYGNGNDSAPVDVTTSIARIQYQSSSGYVDVSATLFVLKGTSVTFNAVPNPANAQFASGKPVWSGSSGASGTGQTTSVTFNTASSSTNDFKTVTASAGNAVTANIIVIELTGNLAPDDPFSGRSLTDFGIHERITLSASISPSGISVSQLGGLQWVQDAGNGIISAGSDGTGTYNVSDAPGSATLKLKMLNGPSQDSGPVNNLNIVAPSDGSVQKFSGVRHFQNWWSCGYLGDIFISPTNVSFANLYFGEENVSANGTGWLSFTSGIAHCQNGCLGLRIGFGNITSGARVISDGDQIFSGKYRDTEHGSYATGNESWTIPWDYSITGNAGTWHSMTTVQQQATSTSTGKCTITKKGVSVSRELGDLDSEW